jgi:triosephosphate isomerase
MRTSFVAGNWKMNGSASSARALVQAVTKGADQELCTQVDIALCPPFVHLSTVHEVLAEVGSNIGLGAQNVSEHGNGAFTGETSPGMLSDFDCRYVIVGHSERRHVYGETDAQVAAKFIATQAAGMCPILCVGEQLDDREGGRTEAVVARQLDAVIAAASVSAFDAAVVAYEPVWAIGTGKTASPEQAEQVHAFIRARIGEHDATVAQGVRVLYGGSVKGENAAGLFSMSNIDGGLIGGAALDATDFLAICNAARPQA